MRKTINITEDDLRALRAVTVTEVGNKWSPDDVTYGTTAILDTILARVASDQYPDTISEVINQRKQFSAINSDAKGAYGRWQNVPQHKIDSRPDVQSAIDEALIQRGLGAPAPTEDRMNFANPHTDFSGDNARPGGWVYGMDRDPRTVRFGSKRRKDQHIHGYLDWQKRFLPPKVTLDDAVIDAIAPDIDPFVLPRMKPDPESDDAPRTILGGDPGVAYLKAQRERENIRKALRNADGSVIGQGPPRRGRAGPRPNYGVPPTELDVLEPFGGAGPATPLPHPGQTENAYLDALSDELNTASPSIDFDPREQHSGYAVNPSEMAPPAPRAHTVPRPKPSFGQPLNGSSETTGDLLPRPRAKPRAPSRKRLPQRSGLRQRDIQLTGASQVSLAARPADPKDERRRMLMARALLGEFGI